MFAAHIFSHGGEALPYRMACPEDGAEDVPLILFLHGVGERGADNEAQCRVGVPALAATCRNSGQPAIVVAPQCPADEMWAPVNSDWTGVERCASPPAAQRLAVALVRELAATLPVDPRRLYLTGLSMGGFGVWDILWREPELFAAALPICGGGLVQEAAAMRAVPTWAFHGARDPLVPVEQSRRMVTAREAAGSGVKFTEFPDGGHDIWDRVYSDAAVLEWLLAQRR